MVTRIRHNPFVRDLLVFLTFCLFTALLTWPYVTHWRDAVVDHGDPYLVSWILWWDYHQTLTDPLHLFHANLFYPLRYTLAFSENSYGISLLFFPLYALGARPLTVHTVAMFFGFVTCGYAAFRLARTLTGSNGAAWIAGIIFAFVPFRFGMMSHLPYLFSMWIPLLFEALVLFARERSKGRATWLGVAFFMSGLTAITWFVFSLVPFVVVAAVLLTRYRIWGDRKFWFRGGVALSLASLALLPFLLPYYLAARLYNFQRSVEEVKSWSAWPMHWLSAEPRNKMWHGMGDSLPNAARFRLFPGLLPILLSLAAFLFAASRRAAKGANFLQPLRSQWRGDAFWLGLVWTIIGFCYSLGWNSFFYRILYDVLPLFRSLRVAARGAMFAYLGLAILSGLGAKRLAGLIGERNPRVRPAVFVTIAVLLLFEFNAAPLQFIRGDVDPDAVTQRLKETPMRGGIVVLPANEHVNHRHVLRSADHMKPLIVGISGFNSTYESAIEVATLSGPIPATFMKFLEEVPTSYIVIQNNLIAPERRADYATFLGAALIAGRLRFISRFDGRDDLYAVVKNEPQAKTEAPLPFTLETKEWETLVKEDPANLLGQFRWASQTIYRFYVASYGQMPRYAEFLPDVEWIGRGVGANSLDEQPKLEKNLSQFAEHWVARAKFGTLYHAMTNERFVDELTANTRLNLGPADRAAFIEKLNNGAETRAQTLLAIVNNPGFAEREWKRSLVLLHYFGYLHRDPDAAPDGNLNGFNFWLREVEVSGDIGRLSRGFMASGEYKDRKKK